MVRVGVDIGGTFTDSVQVDPETDTITIAKVPTTPHDPSISFFQGIEQLDVDVASIGYLAHGTTIATNAALTRTGARVGLITTRGFRDVLEIMRTHRKTLFDLYEEKPLPLVPRHLRREVTERVDWSGKIIVPLDEEEVRAMVRDFLAAGVRCIAVSLLFSFANPTHEQRIRALIDEEFSDVEHVSLSCEVLPAYKEYERTSTTVLNAYTAPVMDRYLGRIEAGLREREYSGDLIVMQGSGGGMTAAEARRRPVYTLLSGPAGGVMGGYYVARAAGFTNVLTMDMGGTSFEVASVADGTPDRAMGFEIGDTPTQHGHAVALPTIDVRSIGAGGGSIAWIDAGGALKVGPRSAGSMPGPVCYGRGGTEPTVTDANVVLGRYNPNFILGGDMAIDHDAACHAIEEQIAGPLGVSAEAAALGILNVVNSNMSYAVRYVSIEQGRDPREFAAVAFGGAGPSHAAHIAQETGIPTVIVPPFPGCTSAFGVLAADIQHHFVRTIAAPCDEVDLNKVNALYEEMTQRAEDRLTRDGIVAGDRIVRCEADLRYYGQAYELTIPVPANGRIGRADIDTITTAFHRQHESLYGHAFPDNVPELVNLRITGIGRVPQVHLPEQASDDASPAPARIGERDVYWGERDGFVPTAVYDRGTLAAGTAVEGPAIVEQMDTTTVIPPEKRATIDRVGNILIEI